MSKPINNHIFDEEQKIRTKNLELTRALQDVDRLTTEAVQYKLEIIELKEKITDLLNFNKRLQPVELTIEMDPEYGEYPDIRDINNEQMADVDEDKRLFRYLTDDEMNVKEGIYHEK